MTSKLVLTVRSLGYKVLIREILRRLIGLNYSIKGIPIYTNKMFRALRALALKGYDVIYLSETKLIKVKTDWGLISLPFKEEYYDIISNALRVIAEVEDMYGKLDVHDKVVIDIGALAGETSIYFIQKGAAKVFAFEPHPKHFKYMLDVIKVNGVSKDLLVARNYGLWFEHDTVTVLDNVGATGLNPTMGVGNSSAIKLIVKPLHYLINDVKNSMEAIGSKFLVAKIDCEGCEYALINTECDVLTMINEYVIEIHGSPTPIVYRMKRCGFKGHAIKYVESCCNLLSIWHFVKSKT